MDRRRFLLTSLAGALATPLVAEAQQAGKVWRIAYLGNSSAALGVSMIGSLGSSLRRFNPRSMSL